MRLKRWIATVNQSRTSKHTSASILMKLIVRPPSHSSMTVCSETAGTLVLCSQNTAGEFSSLAAATEQGRAGKVLAWLLWRSTYLTPYLSTSYQFISTRPCGTRICGYVLAVWQCIGQLVANVAAASARLVGSSMLGSRRQHSQH